MSEVADKLKIALVGIDKDEVSHPDGWWETSVGAEFGSSMLEQVMRIASDADYAIATRPPVTVQEAAKMLLGAFNADLTNDADAMVEGLGSDMYSVTAWLRALAENEAGE